MIRSTHLSLLVTESPQAMALKAAELIEARCREAMAKRGRFTLAVSGGKTPIELFRLLSSPEWVGRISWERTSLYWVDEHCVPTDDAESNYGMAKAELLGHIPLTHFYRIKGEDDPMQAADQYEKFLRQHFELAEGEFPRFDCILLGVGDDGHIGSIFPGYTAATEKKRMVVDQYLHKLKSSRVTMTLPVLNNSRCCIFMASGKEKNPVLSISLNLMSEPTLPAQMVRPRKGQLCWIIDEDAYRG